jgi:hypothetical protein
MTAGRSVTAQEGHGDDQCMGLVSLASVYFSNPFLWPRYILVTQ